MQNSIIQDFGNKVRVRTCGILIENEKVLLLKHKGLGEEGFLWLPPGGGVDFGETVAETLKREFLEETNLIVEVGRFLHFREFVKPPLHAVELYFRVERVGGMLELGTDPDSSEQIIVEVKWFSISEIQQTPTEYLASDLKELILAT
jgi:8-oxo-dGTP diphosphatase